MQRERLFASARQAVADSAPGTWIALADPRGNPHAWWGDAPSRIPQVRAPGTLEVRWSATRMELLHWSLAGRGPFAGVVCAGRALPVQAPRLRRALGSLGASRGLGADRAGREAPRPARDRGNAALLAGTTHGASGRPGFQTRILVLALVLAIASRTRRRRKRLAGDRRRTRDRFPRRGSVCRGRGPCPRRAAPLAPGGGALPPAGRARPPSQPGARAAGRRLAAGYGLFAGALPPRTARPCRTSGARLPVWSAQFLGLVALTALTASALAIGAGAGPRSGRGAWTGAAVGITSAGILASLLLVSPSRAYPVLVGAAAVVAYETWRRAIAAAPGSGALGPFRLAAGTTLLLRASGRAAPRASARGFGVLGRPRDSPSRPRADLGERPSSRSAEPWSGSSASTWRRSFPRRSTTSTSRISPTVSGATGRRRRPRKR